MAHVITHFFPGGTAEQYEAVVQTAHPAGALPPGQSFHVAGPTEGGWLVVAVWDSKATSDRFVHEVLVPTLASVPNGFAGPPVERSAEVASLVASVHV
jgi:hypothetical protein